jgi:glucose/arabinose dehydrogenase
MSVGAPCNVCLSPPMVSSIVRMKPDGSGMEVFAEGVRNSVGFDWHPMTRELWFTDNGRDMLGDDVPNDELNIAPKTGLHFGFPYCHQGDVTDPEFGAQRACSTTEPPVLKLGAHVAAIGFTFYTGDTLTCASLTRPSAVSFWQLPHSHRSRRSFERRAAPR